MGISKPVIGLVLISLACISLYFLFSSNTNLAGLKLVFVDEEEPLTRIKEEEPPTRIKEEELLIILGEENMLKIFDPVIIPVPGANYLGRDYYDQANREANNNADDVEFISNVELTQHCTTEERVCVGLDGGKWMCHPRVLLTRPDEDCVVYSFGSNAQVDFELEILKIGPNCSIHVFDPTPGIMERVQDMKLPKQIHFHDYGLSAPSVKEINISGQQVRTKHLAEIMGELGHTYLQHLKIDIEGSELSPGFVDTAPDSPWRKV